MKKYTSDHQVTVKDADGRVINSYVAKDQIDFVKTGGNTLQPVMIVLLCVTLLLSVLPVALLTLLLVRSVKLINLLKYCSEDKDLLAQYGYSSKTELKKKSHLRLGLLTLLGLPATLLLQYLILTGDFASLEVLLGEFLYELADIFGQTYYGQIFPHHWVWNLQNESNFFNRLLAIYSEVWPQVLLLPTLLGTLFYGKEKAILALTSYKPGYIITLLTLPYIAVHTCITLPFRALGIVKPKLGAVKN